MSMVGRIKGVALIASAFLGAHLHDQFGEALATSLNYNPVDVAFTVGAVLGFLSMLGFMKLAQGDK